MNDGRLGLDSLLGFVAWGRSLSLSEPHVPHLQDSVGLVSTSVLPACVPGPLTSARLQPQGQVPFALSLFTCLVQLAASSQHHGREQVGKHGLRCVCVDGAQPCSQSAMEACMQSFKGIPFFKIALPSAGNVLFITENLWHQQANGAVGFFF